MGSLCSPGEPVLGLCGVPRAPPNLPRVWGSQGLRILFPTEFGAPVRGSQPFPSLRLQGSPWGGSNPPFPRGFGGPGSRGEGDGGRRTMQRGRGQRQEGPGGTREEFWGILEGRKGENRHGQQGEVSPRVSPLCPCPCLPCDPPGVPLPVRPSCPRPRRVHPVCLPSVRPPCPLLVSPVILPVSPPRSHTCRSRVVPPVSPPCPCPPPGTGSGSGLAETAPPRAPSATEPLAGPTRAPSRPPGAPGTPEAPRSPP